MRANWREFRWQTQMLVAKIALETETVSPGSSTPTPMTIDCRWQDTTNLEYEYYIAVVGGRGAVVETVASGLYWKKSRCLCDMRNCFGPFGRTRRARVSKAGHKSLVLTLRGNVRHLATRAHKRRRLVANRALEANISIHNIPQSRAPTPYRGPFLSGSRSAGLECSRPL